MPQEAPGRRYEATATKATTHGAPVVELNHAGIAAKSANPAPMAPSLANAAIAQQIGIGEGFIIMLDGAHTFASSLLPGGAAVGDPIYIRKADNVLVNAAAALTSGILQAGFAKFGLLDAIDTTLSTATVNLTQRSAF